MSENEKRCAHCGDLFTDHSGSKCLKCPCGSNVKSASQRWAEQVSAERARAIGRGYTPEHDAEHGLDHLLEQALHYLRLGEGIKAAGLIVAARELLATPAPVSGDDREALNDAISGAWDFDRTGWGVITDAIIAAGWTRSPAVQVDAASEDEWADHLHDLGPVYTVIADEDGDSEMVACIPISAVAEYLTATALRSPVGDGQ